VGVAALAGAALGLLHAILTVPLGLSQHVSGLGVTLLGTSLASYAYRVTLPRVTTPPTIEPFAPMTWLPVPLLSGETPLTLLALVSVPALAYVLNRTPVGLAVRMVGENPGAAEGQGIDVIAVRMWTVVAGSALMGIAGAFLTLSAFNAFFFNMVNGRGWICVALVVFASWRPGKALGGALLFAAFDALQLRMQQASGAKLPYQIYLMLPYALSILALVVMARRAAYPQALMKPYRKGERCRRNVQRPFNTISSCAMRRCRMAAAAWTSPSATAASRRSRRRASSIPRAARPSSMRRASS